MVLRWKSHSTGPPVASAKAGKAATTASVLPRSPAAATSRGVVAGSSGRRRYKATASAARVTTKTRSPQPSRSSSYGSGRLMSTAAGGAPLPKLYLTGPPRPGGGRRAIQPHHDSDQAKHH